MDNIDMGSKESTQDIKIWNEGEKMDFFKTIYWIIGITLIFFLIKLELKRELKIFKNEILSLEQMSEINRVTMTEKEKEDFLSKAREKQNIY